MALDAHDISLPLLLRLNAQDSYREFVRQSWHLLEPRTPLAWNWHLDLICEHLEEVAAGRCNRLIVNVPPRSMKSTLISIMWPCWCWVRRPSMRFLCASYSSVLSLKHSRDRRALLAAGWFQRNWSLKFADDSNTQSEFSNVQRGHMISTSVGGSATGKGGDALICDDLLNPEMANSPAERESALRFFDESLFSRLDDKRAGIIIVVEQRTHSNDLSGHLLPEGNWTHVNLPAEFDARTVYSFPRSNRKVEIGESDLLWASRDDRASLDAAKLRVGSYAYTLQYLQRPTQRGGNYFQRAHFGTFTEWPRVFDRLVLSLDCSYGKNDAGDFSAAVVIGEVRERRDAPPGYYVLHVVRGRWPFGQLKSEVLDLAHLWQPFEILAEDTASGQSLIQELRFGTALRIRAIKVAGDKQYRAAAASPAVESRLVYLQAGAAWIPDFLDEVCNFPSAPHDDQLDAFTQCVNYLRGQPQHHARVADLSTGARFGGSPRGFASIGAEHFVCRELGSGAIMFDSRFGGRPPIVAALPNGTPGAPNVCMRCSALISPMALRTFAPVIGKDNDGAPIYGTVERLCSLCLRRAANDERRATRGR